MSLLCFAQILMAQVGSTDHLIVGGGCSFDIFVTLLPGSGPSSGVTLITGL